MQNYVSLVQQLGRPVAYHPGLARMLGSVKAGILLDQLLYWWPRRNGKGVFKTAEDLTEETGLSKKEQMGARKILRDRGILTEDYDRLNHRLWFFIDERAINDQLQAMVGTSRSDKTEPPEVTKGNFGKEPFVTSSYTEITTETTTETSRAVARVPEGSPTKRKPPKMRDELAQYIDDAMRAVHPYENFARERGQIKTICARCRRRDPDDPQQVADAMLAMFAHLREHGSAFWQKQPFVPSALSSLWERIEQEGKSVAEEIEKKREFQAWLAEG